MPTSIVWYKPTDLRIHDHQPLCQAHLDSICSTSGFTNAVDDVLHVLVLDSALGYGKTTASSLSSVKKLPRIGPIRARFLVEAIQDLHTQLANQQQQQTLLVFVGVSTTLVFRELLQQYNVRAIYTHGPEFCSEERQIEQDMKQLLVQQHPPNRLQMFWGWTLHHPDDLKSLPITTNNNNNRRRNRNNNNKNKNSGNNRTTTTTPSSSPSSSSTATHYQPPERYKDFLNQVCSKNKRSICFRSPGPDQPIAWAKPAADFSSVPSDDAHPNNNINNRVHPIDPTKLTIHDIVRPEVLIPVLKNDDDAEDEEGMKPEQSQQQQEEESSERVIGGETAALNAMNEYIWKQDRLRNYVGSSDSMTPGKHNAINSTSGLSPYLAFGCLSPRTLYCQVLKYEKQRQKNRSTYWIFHELVFRDYFVFLSLYKWKEKLFRLSGPDNGSINHPWRKDGKHAQKLFDLWRTGRTGYPMVDAGMRQLVTTGHMPHLVRQMVAGFLVRDLRLDWRWGAEWFEQCLLDYTPDANYGNWAYRILPLQQLMPLETKHLTSLELISWPVVHDPHLEYTLRWVPELRQILKQSPTTDDNNNNNNSSSNLKVLVREPWRNDDDYGKLDEINVKPHKDSPLWIMSVNRSNWPEYQQMMTGTAYKLKWKSKRIGDVVHKEKCPYAYPIVAPLELQILHDKIPLDHSWGDSNDSNSSNKTNSIGGKNRSNTGVNNNNNNNRNDNRNRNRNQNRNNNQIPVGTGEPSSITTATKQASNNGRKRPRNRGRGRKQNQPTQ